MAGTQAEIHLLKSEYAQAKNIYTQVAETNTPDRNAEVYAYALLNIVQIDIKIGGNAETVHQKLNQVKDVFSNHKSPLEIVYCDMSQADIDLREKKFDIAKCKFLEGRKTDSQVESFCLERLADIKAWPTSEWQFRWPVIYCLYVYKSKEKLAPHKALLFLGDVFTATRDDTTAANLYVVALDGFTDMEVHHSRAQCMLRLGEIAERQGQTSEAITLWKTARPLFEQSLQAKEVAQIDIRLATV
jgi:tetratricopeptide (TPR) repeat protein